MGELHLDIVKIESYREYNLVVKVVYRETIVCVEEYVHKKQTGGAGQFAKVKILFEPNDKDEFVFVSKIVGGALFLKNLYLVLKRDLNLLYPVVWT